MQKKTYTYQEAQSKLEHYCAYQERCHKEVRAKLINMHMIPEVIDQIVCHLIDQNYLNEERFAISFARGKHVIKKWGRVRIKNALKQKEISPYNIKKALKQFEDAEYIKTFEDIAHKGFVSIKETNPFKKRKKLIQYLIYRGWEPNLVYDKVYELIKP